MRRRLGVALILHIGFWVTVVTLVLAGEKICGANNCHNKKVDLVTEVHCEGVATVGVGRVRFLGTVDIFETRAFLT